MPVRFQMNLKGLDEYLENIAKVGRDVDASADRALIAGADVAVFGMQARAPVGKPPEDEHPGLLKATLKRSEPERDGDLHTIEAGILDDAPAEVARYGTAQEYGSTNMAAQPYIRPTMDIDKGKIRAAQRKSLEADGML